jgi:hypothetical protein
VRGDLASRATFLTFFKQGMTPSMYEDYRKAVQSRIPSKSRGVMKRVDLSFWGILVVIALVAFGFNGGGVALLICPHWTYSLHAG